MLVPTSWGGVNGCVGECRPKNLAFVDAANVTVAGVQLLDSADWTVLLRRCVNVTVDRVFTSNPRSHPNGDGIDVESGSDIALTNLVTSTGDDAIALRSGNCNALRTPWPQPWGHIQPLERVLIENCTLTSTSAALKIEALFQLDHGNVTDITIRNVTLLGNRGLGIWQRISTTSVIARVALSNATIDVGFQAGSDWWGSGEAIVITSVPENANQVGVAGGGGGGRRGMLQLGACSHARPMIGCADCRAAYDQTAASARWVAMGASLPLSVRRRDCMLGGA
jgi:polygalacturonase